MHLGSSDLDLFGRKTRAIRILYDPVARNRVGLAYKESRKILINLLVLHVVSMDKDTSLVAQSRLTHIFVPCLEVAARGCDCCSCGGASCRTAPCHRRRGTAAVGAPSAASGRGEGRSRASR